MEGLIFNGIFWGLVVILFGVSIILNAMFNIHIPFVRILLAIIFIYIGIVILTGGFKFNGKIDKNNVVFGEGTMQYGGDNQSREFNVIFGRGTTVLNELKAGNGENRIRINVVFGEGIVEIDPNVPMIIRTSSAFASAFMPDKTMTSFGEYTYKTPAFGKDKNYLDVEASVVFGALRFQEVEKKKK